MFAGAVSLLPNAHAVSPDLDAPGWENLFNGKNLEGWHPKVTGYEFGHNYADTWRVKKGLLQVRYNQYEHFGDKFSHLFFAKPFSHYALHIEYRFVGQQAPGGPPGWGVRNSGIMLHSQKGVTMTKNQKYPRAIEAQFLGGLSNNKPRPTMNLCTPGTHVHINNQLFTQHCKLSSSPTFDGDQWVNAVVVVLGGGRIRHFVNGEEVLTYTQPVLDKSSAHARTGNRKNIESGYIALQSESHPVDFRQVRLLSLAGCTDPTASNFKPYAVKSEPGSCRY